MAGVDKTQNMEHPGTFRNILEHPGTSRNMKNKNNLYEKIYIYNKIMIIK